MWYKHSVLIGEKYLLSDYKWFLFLWLNSALYHPPHHALFKSSCLIPGHGARYSSGVHQEDNEAQSHSLTLTMPGKVQICTLNFESLYRVLNGFLGGWGGHDFIRIVMIFNFRPFLGLNSIINMVFIMIMCLHSPLHTCRANFTRPALQKTNSKY